MCDHITDRHLEAGSGEMYCDVRDLSHSGMLVHGLRNLRCILIEIAIHKVRF